jgi:hypothetical protein
MDMRTEPDAIIEVRFLTTAEGGKKKTPVAGFGYRATFQIDNEYNDGGFLWAGPPIEAGVSYEVPVFFLRPDLVFPKLMEGKQLTLWEGKLVATGKIIRVLAERGTT